MNTHSLVFSGMLAVLAYCVADASAQQLPLRRSPPGVQAMPGLPGPGQPGGAEARKLLSSNHRILFSGRSGDKSLGELSSLTCSPDVALSGPFDESAVPATLNVIGRIEERDGGVIAFEYSLSFHVPIPAQPVTGVAPGGPVVSSVSYREQTTSGCLLMKPGQAYEVLKVGGVVHTVTITPEPGK